MSPTPDTPITLAIATPLQPDLVERIRQEVPEVEVAYQPDLLPPERFPNDHHGESGFSRTPEQQQRYAALVANAEVLFGAPDDSAAGLRDVVRSSGRLRWIAGTAAGAGQQVAAADLTEDELQRVLFTAARGVHARQLAEWAMLGLLWVVKDGGRLVADREARRWEHRPTEELSGRRLLIVGLGEIGRATAIRARAFGMHVTGVRRSVRAGDPDGDVDDLVATDRLADVVPTSDAVVLALPGGTGTEQLLSRSLIDALPRHAAVVNVGRGGTIDEAALIAALQENRLAGAALDVTADEPPADGSPLWTLPNVLLSPHTAALSVNENERIVDQLIANLRRLLADEPLHQLVDTAHFY